MVEFLLKMPSSADVLILFSLFSTEPAFVWKTVHFLKTLRFTMERLFTPAVALLYPSTLLDADSFQITHLIMEQCSIANKELVTSTPETPLFRITVLRYQAALFS